MSTEHSVTGWIAAMKDGDEDAFERLYQRYLDKLVRVARGVYGGQLDDISRPTEDEEDAAQSALKTFWRRAATFTKLTNRNDLNNLLISSSLLKCGLMESQQSRLPTNSM